MSSRCSFPEKHHLYFLKASLRCTHCVCLPVHTQVHNSCERGYLKGAQSRFAHIEKFSLNFSNSSFAIRVNLLHPQPSLFLYGLSLSLLCLSILLNCYFQISYHLKVILYVAKITQNTVTEPLQIGSLGPRLCYFHFFVLFPFLALSNISPK